MLGKFLRYTLKINLSVESLNGETEHTIATGTLKLDFGCTWFINWAPGPKLSIAMLYKAKLKPRRYQSWQTATTVGVLYVESKHLTSGVQWYHSLADGMVLTYLFAEDVRRRSNPSLWSPAIGEMAEEGWIRLVPAMIVYAAEDIVVVVLGLSQQPHSGRGWCQQPCLGMAVSSD
ncbi:hypothetical protein PanWU01x14_108390, partial [Parasponia andersonii]